MPLSEFIHEARRLAELCNYPNDQDRLIRDTIVSGIQSLRGGRCGKKGHLDSLCRSTRTPLHMLEAQDYSSPQPTQSQETPQDYNQRLETAQYSTPHFMSKEELPQMACKSLKTVQVSRLGANEQSEHI